MKEIRLVKVPVADLRREPQESKSVFGKDLLQETQLLFGEQVLVLEMKDEWLYVEAVEQQKYSENETWQGYPGWIKANQTIVFSMIDTPNLVVNTLWGGIYGNPNLKKRDFEVSFGTRLVGLRCLEECWHLQLPNGSEGWIAKNEITLLELKQEIGSSIIELGKKFLGFPYFWGGRSAYHAHLAQTSVDCSSFVNLLYRVHGLDVPRNAHDQFLKCRLLKDEELRIGDLIFKASGAYPEKITHVMLYAGDNMLLEATADSGNVRMISVKERLGCTLEEMPWGGSNGKEFYYYGSFGLSSKRKKN